MTEFIYMWLQKLGFNHPLHVPVTHVPMGMVIGGCVFAVCAVAAGKPELSRTALHCYVLALLAMPPTMFIGYMDWQHFLQGAPNPFVIAKIVLAFLLMIVCWINIRLLGKDPRHRAGILAANVGALILAGLIGYFGGELQYGS